MPDLIVNGVPEDDKLIRAAGLGERVDDCVGEVRPLSQYHNSLATQIIQMRYF